MKRLLPFVAIIAASLVVATASWLPSVMGAAAPKRTIGGGSYQPGQPVTVEIEIAKPAAPTAPLTPIEVMIAVDLSGSVSQQFEANRQVLRDFADSLLQKTASGQVTRSYLGLIRVGIYKFGSGSGGFPARVIATEADLNALKTAIDTLAVGGEGQGYSDVTGGIRDANSGFTTAATKKYLILQTDGYQNLPYADGGRCPIRIQGGNSGYRIPGQVMTSTNFIIVPSTGSETQYAWKLNNSDASPCGGSIHSGTPRALDAYVSYRYDKHIANIDCNVGEDSGSGTPACEMLREMTIVYPNASKSTSMTGPLAQITTDLNAIQQIKTIEVADSLNSNVFDSDRGIENMRVVRCGTTTSIGSSALFTTDLTVFGYIRVTDQAESRYCLRFFAYIKSSPSVGSLPINSSVGNVIRYRNSMGAVLATDTIQPGAISVVNTYRPPSNLSATGSCRQIEFRWSAGSNVSTYRLELRDTASGTITPYTNISGGATSYTASGLALMPTTYEWQLIPIRNLYGYIVEDAEALPTLQVSTATCLRFTTALGPSVTLQPGGTERYQRVLVDFLPSRADWGSNTVALKVVAIGQGIVSCRDYHDHSTPVTSGSGITMGFAHLSPHVLASTTIPASPNIPLTLTITAAASAPLGRYTYCLSSASTAGTTSTPMIDGTIYVAESPWLQIGAPPGSLASGDVHSNGALDLGVPASKYFYADGAGVVSSRGAAAIRRALLHPTTQWSVSNYAPAVKTPTFAQLVGQLITEPSAIRDTPALSDHIAGRCTTGSSGVYRLEGTIRITKGISLTPANCPNSRLIYVIDGNLDITTRIVDTTSTSALVFIVSGNVSVGGGVDRLDGVYVFGGHFSDGAGATALTVNGSLIGLGGSAPTGLTGSFQSGLARDLDSGNTSPAEVINYDAKYLVLLNGFFGDSILHWGE